MKMYLFVNTSLKMKKGKIASQIAHVVYQLTNQMSDLEKSQFQQTNEDIYVYKFFPLHDPKNFDLLFKLIVMQLFTKCKIGLDQFDRVIEHRYYDKGITQVPEGSLTCAGIITNLDLRECLLQKHLDLISLL